jgi:hypothetical protein
LKSQAVNATLATPPSKTAASLISYRAGTSGNENTIEEAEEDDDNETEGNRLGEGRSVAEALAAEFAAG